MAQQPCDRCGASVTVHAASYSECYCTLECLEMDEQEKLELAFLRYFYKRADRAMGPASGDIYDMIREDYVKEGGVLPEAYLEEEE